VLRPGPPRVRCRSTNRVPDEVRATVTSGATPSLMEPVYHQDPVRLEEGSWCTRCSRRGCWPSAQARLPHEHIFSQATGTACWVPTASSRVDQGVSGTPKLLLVRAPEPEQTRRVLEALLGGYPDHEVSVLITRSEKAIFAGEPGIARTYVADRHAGGGPASPGPRAAAADLRRGRPPWQPGAQGPHLILSVGLSILAKARTRVVVGAEAPATAPEMAQGRPPILDLLAFLAVARSRACNVAGLVVTGRVAATPTTAPGKARARSRSWSRSCPTSRTPSSTGRCCRCSRKCSAAAVLVCAKQGFSSG